MATDENSTCDCWAATIRVVNQSKTAWQQHQNQNQQQQQQQQQQQRSAKPGPAGQDKDNPEATAAPDTETTTTSSSAKNKTTSTTTTSTAPATSIGDLLVLGQNLAQHWDALNRCAASTSATHYARPMAVSLFTDALERTAVLYEDAIARVLQNPDGAAAIDPTFLGSMQLDDAEAAVVAREAMRYVVGRLAGVLRAIDAEVGTYDAQGIRDDKARQVEDEVRLAGLGERLRRLEGSLGDLGAV
ncbi:hypothetical protein B0T19DRAFT_284120 [Cercophora scortea]|uniref:Uncharacterized protein n=1 Tax=Cercophora scortea TaxID=314031 RepID=A0AAE0I827_9PEZI|nr:hypothetical protein B0T19DRAFT_284120 [Cercophora scortea]